MEMVSLVLSLSLLLFITYKPYEAAWLNQAVEVACSAASVSSESSQVPFWNDTELRLLLAAMALQRQTFGGAEQSDHSDFMLRLWDLGVRFQG